jgi:hypothetical protein
MVRRIIVLLIVAAAGYYIYANRHYFAELAGLGSNRLRIEGDWSQIRSNIKEADVYTFFDRMIERNGTACGQYHFRSNEEVVITIDGRTASYTVAFPDAETMIWYHDDRGTLKPRVRWAR